jgi:hypothetical protein
MVNQDLYKVYLQCDLHILKSCGFGHIETGTQLNLFEDSFLYWNIEHFEKNLEEFKEFEKWMLTLPIIKIHYWMGYKIPELEFEPFEVFLKTPEKLLEIIEKVTSKNYEVMIQKHLNRTSIYIDNGRFRQR